MSRMERTRVFVAGAGVVCALGRGVPALQEGLEAGRSGIAPVARFDARRLRHRAAGWCDLSLHDGAARRLREETGAPFPLDPDENPKMLFALDAMEEALAPLPAASRAGTLLFHGAGLEEVRIDRIVPAPSADRPICPELPSAMQADALARLAGLARPARTLVSACAASAQAIAEALCALRRGEAELALAGGADSMISPFALNAFGALGALSEGDAPLAPFDRNRRGTALGEGAAYLLLAAGEAAERLGLVPRAELLGAGSSMDACHPVQPDPDGGGAALAIRRALKDAGCDPEEIDLVNAHGSGTLQNDVAECRAIRAVYGEGEAAPLVVSSKPHFGHLLAAGGAIEAVCLLLALERGLVTPTLHLANPDPACAANHVMGRARRARIRRGASHSFGLNGQNAVLILGRT